MRQGMFSMVAGALSLAACTPSVSSDTQPEGNKLCIPEQYSVALPTGSSPATTGLDPEGGGYGTNIRIDGEQLVQWVPEFETQVEVGTHVLNSKPRSKLARMFIISPSM